MADPLTEVLDDPEIHESIVDGLKQYARTGEVTPGLKFYLNVLAPRSARLSPQAGNVEFSTMTPAEEAALLNELMVEWEKGKTNGQSTALQAITEAVGT